MNQKQRSCRVILGYHHFRCCIFALIIFVYWILQLFMPTRQHAAQGPDWLGAGLHHQPAHTTLSVFRWKISKSVTSYAVSACV